MESTTSAHTHSNGELQVKFSVFNPVITYEHREFYEKIHSRLNSTFPICNQGKCTAVEISKNTTEQVQITNLMKRMENFAEELLEVTKKLFDQFYQAKEEFSRSIYSATAYIKINLMDRNLLERTCDVRWWALETAFGDCISYAERVRLELKDLDESLEVIAQRAAEWSDEEEDPRLVRLIGQLRESYANGVDVMIRQEALQTFSHAAKEFVRYAKEQGKHGDIVKTLHALSESLGVVQKKAKFACDRLEDINNSYTLYRDLVITNHEGYIIANSNKETRSRVLGINVGDERWFLEAMATQDGTMYYAQDVAKSKVESIDSLVYSTAIRENSDNNGSVLGAMGIFFDFQGEAKMILDDYQPKDTGGHVADGWFSYFTNEEGMVIASSDICLTEPGRYAQIPPQHRRLDKGKRCDSYMIVAGRESALLSAKTDGYLEYEGLGWTSHVVLPKEVIFRSSNVTETIGISVEELMHSKLIPDINKQTYEKVQNDKQSIKRISLNGIVFASKLGKRGVALGPIFDQITQTGDYATSRMEKLLAEMAIGELDLNLTTLENFSKQAIDLIDRNLFERSADIRWWATDEYFWKALEDPTQDNFAAACRRLQVINGSYTMYRNLVLADGDGSIVATSTANELHRTNCSQHMWFESGMQTTLSCQYVVQDVCDSPLEPQKKTSLVYAGGVRHKGAREGDAIGVLGILFDWDTEAKKILHTCVPRDRDGNVVEGCAAFYTNAASEIIETTDSVQFPVGLKLDLPPAHTKLKAGQAASGIAVFNDKKYFIGTSKTKGYREYEGLGWSAHVLRPLH